MVANASTWRTIRIGSIFDLKKGTRLTRAAMRPGDIPFIGAANNNNGITAHVSNDEHLHPAGTLTVAYNGNGGTGKTFFQNEPFWASDDVHVLYPKVEMSRNQLLFVASCIERAGRLKYGFAEKWRIERMEQDVIKLPVTNGGEVDWDFIDDTMREVVSESRSRLDALTSALGI